MTTAEICGEAIEALSHMSGKTGFYYKDLATGETAGFQEKAQFRAASVYKLPLFAGILLLAHRGEADLFAKVRIAEDEKIPGCGAVQHLTGEPELDVLSLCKLMITISDNTATNALARYFGIERMKPVFRELGLSGTQMNRCLYDLEKEEQGIQNWIVPEELGGLLEGIHRRTLISPEVSAYLEEILLQQQINHKIPGIMGENVPVAHKTGEEDGTTHDVGIVCANRPFVVCFTSNETDVPVFEDFIRKTSWRLYCAAMDQPCRLG
ncbi:serine hydrolase [Bacilliculturomica massiliensis]|uniref:serine hydrolase n=1 Tax=Bacilliculturomica massiliensis TaxID=1917867 RepID=UPI0010300971|nr:serine hydrolase [Bacilliculturomica massiliensis]